jgi:beta propeller repeat protein
MSVVAPGSGDFFTPGIRVPQRAILSTRSSGAGLEADGGGVFTVGGDYLRWAGTSMSAPHVAGIAALVLALHPDYTPDDVRAVIRSSARDLGEPGHDRATGAGLADAARALQIPFPSVRALFSAPAPGEVVVPEAESVVVRGALTGPVADAALAFGFGLDPAHFDPIPLAAPLPDHDGELARWDVAALKDGPYVLRLEVSGSDGSHAVEFLPVSLERNTPKRLSTPGAPAFNPTISGERVVWESARGSDESLGLELYEHDWTSGEERLVVSAPGDQRGAQLSGDRLGWLDARDPVSEVRSCRLETSASPCRDRIAGTGPGQDSLNVSRDTLAWSEGPAGGEQLRGCRWRGGQCRELAFPASAARHLDPILHGSRLWWREQDRQGSVVFTCAGFPERCEPVRVDTKGFPLSLAGSRTRLAWANLEDPSPVYVCRVGADGSCPARLVGRFPGFDVDVAISRHRVVWAAPGPGGDLDIYFCEDDAHTGACPVQRLTGSAAQQLNPDVSGTRVVWEDERFGTSAIAGFELPSLDPVPDRRAVAGRRQRISVHGRDPAGGVLALSAAFADGTPLAARGAAFADRGDGTGVLTWTPRESDAGSHVVTFAGHTLGHLTTRTSVQIDVAVRQPRSAP